jgi:hypothetical protein
VSHAVERSDFHDALVITSDAARDDPFTLAGQRCLVLGGEARGIDEVRIHPHLVARELRVAGLRADSYQASRVGIERTMQLPLCRLRERVLIPLDLPGVVIEWSALYNTDIELRWRTEAAYRSASGGAPMDAGALLVKHPSGDDVLFEIEASEIAWYISETNESNVVDVTCRVRIGTAGVRLIIVSGPGASALESAARLLRQPASIAAARKGALARVQSERPMLRTPDGAIDAAIAWCAHRLRSYEVKFPGTGSTLVDAYCPGRTPAFVTRDAVWAALALLAAGDDALPLHVLQFALQHQDAIGRIPDSCTLDGESQFGSGESTALFLLLAARFTAWTGDFAFTTHAWPAIARACTALAQESRMPARAIALAEIALVAEALGKTQEAAELRALSAAEAAPAQTTQSRARITLPIAGDSTEKRARVAASPGEKDALSLLSAFTECSACVQLAAGHSAAGFETWRSLCYAGFEKTKGAWGEGDCPDASHVTSMLMLALVHGILGAEPDAPKHRLVLRPQIPGEWTSLEVKHLRVGEADIGLRYEREGTRHRFTLEQRAGAVPVRVTFEPLLPASHMTSAHVDGQPAELDPRRFGERLLVPVQIVLDHERVVELEVS